MGLAARWQAMNLCSNKQTNKQFSCDFGKNLSQLCRAKKKNHDFHHAICTHKEIYCVFFYHNNLAMNHCFLGIFCWFFFIQKNYQKKTSLYCVLAALSVLSFRSLNRAYFIGITSILSVCSSALYLATY